MNERIKQLRKCKKITQAQLAKELRKTANYIYMLESGNVAVTDNIIFELCRIYNVNEEWLRTGEGEMFKPLDKEQKIAEITKKMLSEEEDSIRMLFFDIVANLTSDELDTLKRYAHKIADEDKNSHE